MTIITLLSRYIQQLFIAALNYGKDMLNSDSVVLSDSPFAGGPKIACDDK
ncbi:MULTISPECIES: hypothetical protein [Psychrobacter]|nr:MULTISPECIES: hypothetical protein [Psychrobacter]